MQIVSDLLTIIIIVAIVAATIAGLGTVIDAVARRLEGVLSISIHG